MQSVFITSNSYHRRLFIHWNRKYLIAVNTLKGAENVTCAIHCYSVVSMAADRTQGSSVAVPLDRHCVTCLRYLI